MLTRIKASAGSGKTYALTRHFLTLLAGAAAPERALPVWSPIAGAVPYDLGGILAATFTNKAATEMKARVIRDLKSAALSSHNSPGGLHDPSFPLSPAAARRWVDAILRRFDSLNIRTIDSLLALLVRAGTLTLELPPDFTPVFDETEYFDPLYDVLLDRLAAQDQALSAVMRKACRGLIFHGGAKGFLAGDKLREGLLEVLRYALTRRDKEIPLAPDERTLAAIQGYLQGLRDQAARAAGTMLELLEQERLAASAHFRTWVESCRSLPVVPPVAVSAYAEKNCLDECLLKASKGGGSVQAEEAFEALKARFATFMNETPPLRAALELAPFALLTDPLAEELARLQREEGRVPAARMPELARRVLEGEEGVSDAFCRLGNRLVHLLFDEFQDTSRDQWASMAPLALECLSRGGSLTYVGDVKQAIYGWRGGDAALFDEAPRAEELAPLLPGGPERRTLDTNWRSAPAVVAFNNAVFGPLDTRERAEAVLAAMLPAGVPASVMHDGVSSLVAAFSGARQNIPRGKKSGEAQPPGFIRLTRLEGASRDDTTLMVRDSLCSLLEEDLLPRRAPGDIAVLVRRNTEAAGVAAWLTEAGIPVVTEHSFLLHAHPLIQRLTAWLAFLEYPADDEAFWGFISGPELFLPEAGLEADGLSAWLATVRRSGGRRDGVREAGRPLYSLFARDYPEVWERLIAPFHERANLLSAYDTVRELLRCYRVLERLPAHAPFIRRFLEVADAAERQGHSSLSAFLEFWDNKGSKEKVPMPEGMDAVRILTMHKAKGLEFPVVIVPFHHSAATREAELTETTVAGFSVLTRLTRHLGEAYYRQALREALEQINLLYVAWTRPTEELHAFLSTSSRQRGQPGLARAMPLLLQDFSFEGDSCVTRESGVSAIRSPQAAQPDVAACVESTQALRGSDSAPFQPMAWLPRLKIFRNPVGDIAFTERKRGLLAHACLEHLRSTGDAAKDAREALTHALRTFPLPVPDPAAIEREMLGLLTWFLRLPGATDWLARGRAECGLLDDAGNSCRVDLLVDEGDGLLTVEYKTGKPSPAHSAQVRRYLSLLAAATGHPARRVRGVLVYLDLRELVHVTADPVPESGSGSSAA